MNTKPLLLEQAKSYCEMISNLALTHPDQVSKTIISANKNLLSNIINFGGVKQLQFTPSSLILTSNELKELENVGNKLHSLIEKVLAALASGDLNLLNHFSNHKSFLKYLAKNKTHWQGFGRYDFTITPNGKIQFLELNTSCPSSYFYNIYFTNIARKFSIGTSLNLRNENNGPWGDFAIRLCEMEKQAGFAQKTVGILYDENNLNVELDFILKAFTEIGRKAIIADARHLEFKNGRLTINGDELSMTYNKFRICGDQAHKWHNGYENRYRDFLDAYSKNTFLSINNFASMVFSEDKGMLAVFTDEKFKYLFTDSDWHFLQEHIPWTRRLNQDLLDSISDKNQFVIKPANDGRGQAVYIGKFLSNIEWEDVTRKALLGNSILQKYVETLTLPIVSQKENLLKVNKSFHTGSMFYLDNSFSGIFSRVSNNPVTNLCVEGFLQPTFII